MFKPDLATSKQAREDGNAAFKKGRWTESIGHYTTAILNDTNDAAGYTNRAAAYLKLDKYNDAERDCSAALELEKNNKKALYRRALARKGLCSWQAALTDLDALLKLDPANTAALAEKGEVQEGLAKQKAKGKRNFEAPAREESARAPAAASSAGARHGPPAATSAPGEQRTASLGTAPAATEMPATLPMAPKTFASLRTARDTKKTFASASSTTDPPAPAAPAALVRPAPASPTLLAPPPTTVRPPTPPADPSSTAPGAGLQLLRRLSSYRSEPLQGYQLLAHYPPAVLFQILNGLLEPDVLGQILVCLHAGSGQDDQHATVKAIMEALRKTSRWRMNAAMLDPQEKRAGLEAWAACAGVGAWP